MFFFFISVLSWLGRRPIGDWSATSRGPVPDRSATSCIKSQRGPHEVADQSPISRQPVPDWSPTSRRPTAKPSCDFSATSAIVLNFGRGEVAERLQCMSDLGFKLNGIPMDANRDPDCHVTIDPLSSSTLVHSSTWPGCGINRSYLAVYISCVAVSERLRAFTADWMIDYTFHWKSRILQDPHAAGINKIDFVFVDFSYLQGGLHRYCRKSSIYCQIKFRMNPLLIWSQN